MKAIFIIIAEIVSAIIFYLLVPGVPLSLIIMVSLVVIVMTAIIAIVVAGGIGEAGDGMSSIADSFGDMFGDMSSSD